MSKIEKYSTLVSQIKSLITNETDFIANLSNITSAIHFTFNFHWTGFYFCKQSELVLGPFQGPVACTRLGFGKGVCGKAFLSGKTVNVPDVHKFEGHIACSSLSNSEIVVPIFCNNTTVAVLDIDSVNYNEFDKIDEEYLNRIATIICPLFCDIQLSSV